MKTTTIGFTTKIVKLKDYEARMRDEYFKKVDSLQEIATVARFQETSGAVQSDTAEALERAFNAVNALDCQTLDDWAHNQLNRKEKRLYGAEDNYAAERAQHDSKYGTTEVKLNRDQRYSLTGFCALMTKSGLYLNQATLIKIESDRYTIAEQDGQPIAITIRKIGAKKFRTELSE